MRRRHQSADGEVSPSAASASGAAAARGTGGLRAPRSLAWPCPAPAGITSMDRLQQQGLADPTHRAAGHRARTRIAWLVNLVPPMRGCPRARSPVHCRRPARRHPGRHWPVARSGTGLAVGQEQAHGRGPGRPFGTAVDIAVLGMEPAGVATWVSARVSVLDDDLRVWRLARPDETVFPASRVLPFACKRP